MKQSNNCLNKISPQSKLSKSVKDGWLVKRLGDVCEIARGGSPRPIQAFLTDSETGINWIKISDATVSSKYIYSTVEKIIPGGIKRSRLVKDGDFILSNSMSFGRPYIMRTTGCIHDGWLVISNYDKLINQDFLYNLLSSKFVYSQFEQLAAGSTVRNLNISLASKVILVIPPLPEQHRIVGILDEVFEAIAKAKANTQKNLNNVRELFDSYLNNIFLHTGAGWVVKRLGDVCDFENGDRGTNYPSRKFRVSNGIPFINAGHFVNSTINLDNMDYISKEHFNLLSNGKICKNDLLFCLRGSLGKFASVEDINEGAIASSLVIVRPKDGVVSKYISAYFNSLICSKMIALYKNGAAQPNLAAASLKLFIIPVPPLPEQHRIVVKLDALSKETKRLEEIYQAKLKALDELKESILDKAFNGEL